MKQYDVIVVGGGHAGTEAALAAARMGMQTLLLTQQIETLGQMSCNPAIGGIGKSHLVKEIDALGGIMALAADHAGIQFRVLNDSKGPAVRATRAQADRALYKAFVRKALENQLNLTLFQQTVDALLLDHGRVVGVVTQLGLELKAKTVILTAGTFLAGKIHVGPVNYTAGRAGESASLTLAHGLRDLGLRIGRLKTGTPPRIDARSIDFSQLIEQPGDNPCPVFSYLGTVADHPRQISCYITHTTEKTHDIIRNNLQQSAMYSGAIEGIGPRYCPSIEDKIVRFDRSSHQIFVEPEGLQTHEVYPNGLSTSLPFAVQLEFVRSIKGFANAHITRPGYAIEYDFFDPRDLKPSLETKEISGLFFAGQINGTTGYEEAAAQGLMAGINAALQVRSEAAWTPLRSEAYIGVLIDDLITCGTKEPYRMFTSRAEYRLNLRQDNADLRLTARGRELGCVDDARWQQFVEKQERIVREEQRLRSYWLAPTSKRGEQYAQVFGQVLEREVNAFDLLKRAQMTYQHLMRLPELAPGCDNALVVEQIEIQSRYEGYIQRQQKEIERQSQHQLLRLPIDLDYAAVPGLSHEVRQKLMAVRPTTLGEAARIPGITPAAVSILLIFLRK